MIQSNDITLPKARPYEPGPFNLTWWNANDFCEYYHNKGHKTTSCYKFKNLVQDLIDQGDITVDNNKAPNIDHTIFKDPFVKHDKAKASSSNAQNNTVNYTNVVFDYSINTLSTRDEMVATIIVNPKNRDCVVITRRSKVTLQGVPSNSPPPTSNYNMVDQLKRTPAQISLFELLRISSAHKAVLDKSLQDSVVA